METRFDQVPPTPEEIAEGYREFQGEELANWHFPMMNDYVRNNAYEKALGTALKNGGIVLDIGTGSGLLAMMAVRQGATQVITCEEVPRIASKAKEIIRRNGFADRIQVIPKLSTALVAGVDFPERADILVSETFDDGLLGEFAFKSFRHAIQNLLKPGALLIPQGARVMAIAIESQEIYENHRVELAAGFDVSAFNELAAEIYTGYHLDKMSYRALSKPTPVFEFDFNRIPEPGIIESRFEFEPLDNGSLHAVAYWFELRLDAETTITTAPHLARRSCWKQAVQMLDRTRTVVKDVRHSLVTHHNQEAIWFT